MNRKRLFNGAVWLSLVIFIVLAFLWIRGQWHIDQLTFVADRRDYSRFFAVSSAKRQLGFLTAPTNGLYWGEITWNYSTRPLNSSDGGGISFLDKLTGIRWFFAHGGYKLNGAWFTSGPVPDFNYKTPSGKYITAPWPPALVEFEMPLWPLIILAAILPIIRTPAAVRAARIAYHRRRDPGLCPHCRYDLRGTQGACPECGMPRVISRP